MSPLAALFKLFSLTLRVTQYFLIPAREVNGFATILLVSFSQLPFWDEAAKAAETEVPAAGKAEEVCRMDSA